LEHSEPVTRFPDDDLLIEKNPPPTDLSTLEDLRGKSDYRIELALSDVPVPTSVIPLALNSKVKYFINYFQTGGRQTFSDFFYFLSSTNLRLSSRV
jgi:hypothetical protein